MKFTSDNFTFAYLNPHFSGKGAQNQLQRDWRKFIQSCALSTPALAVSFISGQLDTQLYALKP